MGDTETTISEELRTAAGALRATAAKATRGPWTTHPTTGQSGGDTQTWTVGLPFCNGGAPDPCEPGCAGDVVTTGREGCEEDFLGEGDAAWIALASPTLAEPLASWLESAAWVAGEHPQDPDYEGLPDTRFCTECYDEETTCVAFIDGALAVARVLNGSQP